MTAVTRARLVAMAERVAPMMHRLLSPSDEATLDDVRAGLVASVGGPGDGQTDLLLILLDRTIDDRNALREEVVRLNALLEHAEQHARDLQDGGAS